MSTKIPGTVYVVSILDEGNWRRLLTTQDGEEAEALRAAMEQDHVDVRVDVYPPKR